MTIRGILAMGLVLLVGGALPASAQMMGGAGGMTGMMGGGMPGGAATTGCPGMTGRPAGLGYEGPWLSFALAHARELDLTPDQVKGLTALREEFEKEALRLVGEIRAAEADVWQLERRTPVDIRGLEAKIRAVAGLEADLRIGRLKTIEKGLALLTPDQRQKLTGIAQSMGRMHGAMMMGGPGEVTH